MNTLRAKVNSTEAFVAPGSTILQALRSVGVTVPTLCHDDRLEPVGACRLCIVSVKGLERPVCACSTPVIDGMVVETESDALKASRRATLTMLGHRYPREALAKFPGKEFHRYITQHGLEEELRGTVDSTLVDDSHPYIHVDMSQCVYCARCVRICDEVQGQFVWHLRHRGAAVAILPDGRNLMESSCVSCGACVDACPTGALEDKSVLEHGEPTDWTRTTCPYCGTGCELSVGTRDQHIVAITPAAAAPVNKGHLCSKGRYAFDFVSSRDRILEPMVRENGHWKTVSWDDALSFAADGLRRLISRHGPDTVGVLGSARATNEENYLAQKFARLVVGTNNVDCCARVCHTPSAAALKWMLGTGASTSSFDDIEIARTIMLCGANPTENHPIVGARLKQAARHGARLIVVDARVTELALYAQCHLAPRPGTDIPLFSAIAHTILSEDLADQAFIDRRVDGLDEFAASVEAWPADRAAEICRVRAQDIRTAARIYAMEKPAICFHGLGMTEHVQGTATVMCLINLALLTGNIGQPGTGVNPLRGQNNVQGAAIMGCDPGTLTGSASLAKSRERFQDIWGATLPSRHGLDLLRMMDAASEGTLKALWAIGYDVFLTNANAARTAEALSRLELVIVQDMFMNETARTYGHVFFPACSSFEKDGTFMNAERRVQRVRAVLPPAGESRSDSWIIQSMARAMDRGLNRAGSPEEIWNEIRSLWDDVAGISYERLGEGGIQWPCPSESHPGTTMLYGETFGAGAKARLRPIPYEPTLEVTSDEFPFLLSTGRTLQQFNAGTMTGRTHHRTLRPIDTLDMCPADARRLSLKAGDSVRIISRYGQAVLPLAVTSSMKPGEVFATFHSPEIFLNRVTGPHRDRDVNSPEYKVTAIRIERM